MGVAGGSDFGVKLQFANLNRSSNYEMLLLAVVSLTLILLKISLMLWPIDVKTKTAAAPIKTSNNEYSTISCPCSSLIKLLTKFVIIKDLLIVQR
jgi:hypothetical protein